jgi:hypothetical protein
LSASRANATVKVDLTQAEILQEDSVACGKYRWCQSSVCRRGRRGNRVGQERRIYIKNASARRDEKRLSGVDAFTIARGRNLGAGAVIFTHNDQANANPLGHFRIAALCLAQL